MNQSFSLSSGLLSPLNSATLVRLGLEALIDSYSSTEELSKQFNQHDDLKAGLRQVFVEAEKEQLSRKMNEVGLVDVKSVTTSY